MVKKSNNAIQRNKWHSKMDFALAILTIIIFGSIIAFSMIQAVR